MRRYLARCPSLADGRAPAWLRPELNPVEQIWGNIKGRELANLCPADILRTPRALRAGFARIRGRSTLAFSFLATRRTVVLTCSLPYFTRLISEPAMAKTQ